MSHVYCVLLYSILYVCQFLFVLLWRNEYQQSPYRVTISSLGLLLIDIIRRVLIHNYHVACFMCICIMCFICFYFTRLSFTLCRFYFMPILCQSCAAHATFSAFSTPEFLCRIFLSCIFHPCNLVPHFLFLHFPTLQSGAAFSFPAFSTPAILCRIFFPAFSTPCFFIVPHFIFLAFSVAPTGHWRTGHCRTGSIQSTWSIKKRHQCLWAIGLIVTRYGDCWYSLRHSNTS